MKRKKNCCNYWETKLGGEIDWNACFTKTENTSNETKMVSDQVIAQDSSDQYCVKWA